MLEQIDIWDKELIIGLNRWHSPMTDWLMTWVSHTNVWIPLYIFLLFLLVRVMGRKSIFYILGIVLLIILSDQFTSSFMKPYFARLRPCHSEIAPLLHLPNGCGGKFGFASSHAANTFALAMFWWLSLRKYYKAMHLLFFWAAVVSFSRMYLAAHYFTDVFVGGLIGLALAYLVFKIPEKVLRI
ncbi:MAG: phosphatase PAP2 family protein [Raineya sp.]